MKFQRKRGVSVIVATLLLIAISVSAAIIVYVFVGGLAGNLTQNGGQPVTEKLIIQSFNFALTPTSCACVQQILEIFLLNNGPAITKVSAVYFDGVLQTLAAAPTANTALATGNAYYTSAAGEIQDFTTAACTATAGTAGDFCSTVAGSATHGFGQLYNVGDTGQLIIAFSSAEAYGVGHTVKVVSSTGAQNVYTVEAGISG